MFYINWQKKTGFKTLCECTSRKEAFIKIFELMLQYPNRDVFIGQTCSQDWKSK